MMRWEAVVLCVRRRVTERPSPRPRFQRIVVTLRGGETFLGG
jgi:hypothetical protein